LLRPAQYQGRWSINVWAGIINNFVIGPFFFEGTLTGRSFIHFLENDFEELINNVPQDMRNEMWFQLDGAPPHFAINVRQWLNENFQNKWIGRGSTIRWPARSPDLTPLDFFLWGYVKQKVYVEPPTTAQDMQLRIRQVFASITPIMLERVRGAIISRSRKCIQQLGGHFEHLN